MLKSYWIINKIKDCKKRLFLLFFVCIGSTHSFAQLSDLHYLPPLRQADMTHMNVMAIWLTTPETNSFVVDIYRGTNPTPIANITISSTLTGYYTGAGTSNALQNGAFENNILLIDAGYAGQVIQTAGLRLQSRNGQKFYVNVRGQSSAQAGSLVSKGRQALGTAFKWGGIPSRIIDSRINNCVGIMATQNNTKIHIFGYNPNCKFRWGTNPVNYNSYNKLEYFTLNAGESIVIEAPGVDGTGNIITENIDGWLGASIVSDKDIAVSTGALGFEPANPGGGRDVAWDQIIPEKLVGREYIFIRINGVDATEFPMVIATKNNTEVYVNDETTPIKILNNGEYFQIPASKWSQSAANGSAPGANMYVRTSEPVYAFQSVAGYPGSQINVNQNGSQTCDILFVAPVNWLLNSSMNYIPQIDDNAYSNGNAGMKLTGGITILASASINPNDIVLNYNRNYFSTATSSIPRTTSYTRYPTSTLAAIQKSVKGTNSWKTYYIPGISGDVSVSAPGPIAVGYNGISGDAGVSAYFSGFETIPSISLKVIGNGCLPSTILSAPSGFDAYVWRRSGTVISGVADSIYIPDAAGTFTVQVFKGNQSYITAEQSVYDCKPEIIVSNKVDEDSLISGQTTTFRISVRYLGDGQVDNLVVKNVVPPHMTVVSTAYSYPGSGRTNSITPIAGTSNFNWNIGTLYNDEERLLTVVATANPVTSLTRETYTVSTTQTVAGTLGTKSAQDFTEDIAIYGSCIASMSGTITSTSNPICAGGNATISVNNYVGKIQWQQSSDNNTFSDIIGANSASYNATNLANSIYYRSKAEFGTCINYATSINQIVNPLPVLAAITGPNSINNGSPRLYSNTTSGGVWTSGSPSVASIDINGNLTGIRAGTTTLTYSVTSVNGCNNFVTKSVNIIQAIRTALIKSGQLSIDSSIVTNRNGAKGFGFGRDVTGEIINIPNTPIVTTTEVNSINTTSALSGGSIVSNGGRAILERGVVWDTNSSPTISLSTKTSDGNGNGSFVSNLSGLSSATIYFVRSFVTTSAGTTYGNEIRFTTNTP